MRALTGGIVALLAAACSTQGVPVSEIPESPLAVVYRTPEDSRRHASMLADQDEAKQAAQQENPAPTGEEGVARVKDIANYLKTVTTGVASGPANRRFPGRLGWLEPRTSHIEVVAGAWGEAMPQAWSADRSRLLFTALVEDFAQVFELDVKSGEVHPITHGPGAHPAGCYGPGGSYVLMSARIVNDAVESQIEILEPDSASPLPLTSGPRDYAPSCAEDGSAIVYVTAPQRGVEWVMARDLNGSEEPRRLGPGTEARFCGPGDWIVYSAPVQRGKKLFRMRADGTGRSPVGHGVLDETTPACSPDGGLVVYAVTENHVETLYVRRFDGSGDRILYSDGDASHPVW
jgi:Tol biopolymer transport system component